MSTRSLLFVLGLTQLLLPGCNVDVGDLEITLVKSWRRDQDPLAGIELIRVRVDGPGVRVGPRQFPVEDRTGRLAEVPVGDRRQLTVEGLAYENRLVSRGRSGPLRIEEGKNTLALYFGQLDKQGAFSYSPNPGPRDPRAFHSATLLDDGSVLVCGGITQVTGWRPEAPTQPATPLPPPTATMERFDGNSLRRLASSQESCIPGSGNGCMAAARVGHSATRLRSGNVLIAGGLEAADQAPVAKVEVFNPQDNRFIAGASLTQARAWHRAVVFGSGALLFGGESYTINGSTQTKTFSYSLSGEAFQSGTISALPKLKQGRRAFTLTALPDGTLVAAGGFDRDSGQSPRALESIELRLPGELQWKLSAARLHVPRAYHTATLLDDGTILFIGGLGALTNAAGGGEATGVVERYDPARDSVETLSQPLSNARWAHTSTLLGDGRVLVVGGFALNRFGSPSASIEQLKVLGAGVVQVRPMANMNEPRAGHSATRLASGQLFILGGLSGGGLSRTAEVFVY